MAPRHPVPGGGRPRGGVMGHRDGTQLVCVTLDMPKDSALLPFPSICPPTQHKYQQQTLPLKVTQTTCSRTGNAERLLQSLPQPALPHPPARQSRTKPPLKCD